MSSNTSPITACGFVFWEGERVEGVRIRGAGNVYEAEGFREKYYVPINFTGV